MAIICYAAPPDLSGKSPSFRENGMSLRICKTFIFLLACAVLGACGQKGNLYLPEKAQTAQAFFFNAV